MKRKRESYAGRQWWYTLELTTDVRFTLREMQPSTTKRERPLPEWWERGAGSVYPFGLQPPTSGFGRSGEQLFSSVRPLSTRQVPVECALSTPRVRLEYVFEFPYDRLLLGLGRRISSTPLTQRVLPAC